MPWSIPSEMAYALATALRQPSTTWLSSVSVPPATTRRIVTRAARAVGVDSTRSLAPVIRRADRLSPSELDDLTELLVACVAGGASLGFLAPLARDEARSWWMGSPRDGVMLFVAEWEGRLVGT